ncbi:MAG: hypothetical protein Q8O38_03305, partial [Sulfurimicrobium sp.]|nr:hypothetical protein [Sulfurimicrobium sp.]
FLQLFPRVGVERLFNTPGFIQRLTFALKEGGGGRFWQRRLIRLFLFAASCDEEAQCGGNPEGFHDFVPRLEKWHHFRLSRLLNQARTKIRRRNVGGQEKPQGR